MTIELDQMMVLVVEPSTTQRNLITHYLKQLGILSINFADSVATTFDQLYQYHPDLVISALYLEDGTGTDIITRLRQDETLCETAFMLISSETRFRYLDPIRQAGVTAILPKPFTLEELSMALRTTTDYYANHDLDIENFDPESLKVLIVDDSMMSRNHIRRILQNMGIEQFVEAGDGHEALSHLEQDFFDLIITDYNMPNMDGKELTEHIRHNSSQSAIPILMVTSEENEQRLAAVHSAGVSAVCDKPFDAGTVKNLIQNAMK